MSGLYPVTAGRTSNLLNQQRLLAQIASDQLGLLARQEQISTGRRINTPSEDSQASLRAIGLQRLLEQKTQFKTNLTTSESYLGASENSVSDVSALLIAIRGTALSVADTTSSDLERDAAAITVRNAISQLADSVNREFRGRYLFGGTNTTELPFELRDGHVVYHGDEGTLRSFVDLNLLLDTNVSGHEIVGGLSPEVLGTQDLNPIVTEKTKLADLRGGAGIQSGSIEITDGNTFQTIDISSAVTIGDIVHLIETNAPQGTQIFVRPVENRLELDFIPVNPGDVLTIQEVGTGTTAAELGILGSSAVDSPVFVGGDLNPTLQLTTRLADAFGSRAQAVSRSLGPNNNIVLTAQQHGSDLNGYAIQFVDDELLLASPGLSAGSETVNLTSTATPAQAALTLSGPNNNLVLSGNVSGTALNNVSLEVYDAGAIGNAAQVTYDATGQVLRIGIDSADSTDAQTLLNAINAEGTFTAAYDGSDPLDGGFIPTATVSTANIGVAGNTGNSGAEANTILVHIDVGQSTANSVTAALQSNAQVTALFDITLDEKDTPIAIGAGTGLIDVNAGSTFGGGSGIEFDQTSGVQIVNGDKTHTISLVGAETVEDVLNIFNGSDADVLAEINQRGTGINLRSRLSGADFHIGENGGLTATQLGVRSLDRETELASLNHGLGIELVAGEDFFIRLSDNSEFGVDLSNALTIGDVIDTINNHPANQVAGNRVQAQFVSVGNGLALTADNPTGTATLEIRAVGEAAVLLGLIPGDQRSATATPAQAATASLAFPPPNGTNSAITVTASQTGTALSGYDVVFRDTLVGDVANVTVDTLAQTLFVDLDASSTTSNTIVTAITGEGTFTAQLDLSNDPTNNGTGIPSATGAQATTAGGAADTLVGSDTNPLEVKSAFNSLIRLNQALIEFDLPQIQRAIENLDDDFARLNFARAELGVQQQQVDTFRGRLATEEIELQETLSLEIDVDLTEAISGMLQQQAAYQASLQMIGRTFQLSLLEFL